MEAQWIRSLEKSLATNRQLQFYNLLQIAYLDENGGPELEMIKFLQFESNEGKIYICSMLDMRTSLCKPIGKCDKVQLLWYFPLTREKYRLTSKATLLTSSNHKESPLSATFIKTWIESLDIEQKKEFHSLQPETITTEKSELTEIDRFNSPEKLEISENFGLGVFEVGQVEYTSLPLPQVIANSRNVKFESIFQPYKKTKKYLHWKEGEEWKVLPINP